MILSAASSDSRWSSTTASRHPPFPDLANDERSEPQVRAHNLGADLAPLAFGKTSISCVFLGEKRLQSILALFLSLYRSLPSPLKPSESDTPEQCLTP